MINSIKKYFKKAKEEAGKEYSISNSGQAIPGSSPSEDTGESRLPSAWTGVDLDGTLAYWDSGSSIERIGDPIPNMLDLVKKMIKNGIRIKIFTARATDPDQLPIIRKWLKKNGLGELEITSVKDYYMQRLYDDRCIQVERNTGRLIVDK